MRTKRKLSLISIALLPVLVAVTALYNVQLAHAAASTFVVTNVNDAGAGSLRQAILDANGNGNPSEQDVIEFDIAGFGNKTIEPETALEITQSVRIDGYTQGDAQANDQPSPSPFNNTVRILIDEQLSGPLVIHANDVTLSGLSISRSATAQIVVQQSDGFKLQGSFIGTDQTGWRNFVPVTPTTNDSMIEVLGSANAQIGDGTSGHRNVFGLCYTSCLSVAADDNVSSPGLVVQGNYFGVGADGFTALSKSLDIPAPAIHLLQGADGATIGGDQAQQGNVVQFIKGDALVAQDVDDLTVAANRFVRNVSPETSGAIGLWGVQGARIGGDSAVKGNVIAGNNVGNTYGIRLVDSPDTSRASSQIRVEHNLLGVTRVDGPELENQWGISIDDHTHDVLLQENVVAYAHSGGGINIAAQAQNISILKNSIYSNSGPGIDLDNNNQANTNDQLDADAGANTGLNSPGYTRIVEDGGNTQVTYTADLPAGNYRIEFFSNSSPDLSYPGEGQTYLGFSNITSSGTGLQEYSYTIDGINHTNLALTATQINSESSFGFGPTSEFGTVGQDMPGETGTDLAISKTLLNPQDNHLGGVLNYQVVITNNGPEDLNLAEYNDPNPSGGHSLFTDIMPPELAYNGVSGDAVCIDLGPGSASLFGAILGNHSDYSIVSCASTSSGVLGAGESLTYGISATVINDEQPSFFNYVLSAVPTGDPDAGAIAAMFSSENDVINLFAEQPLNNFDGAGSVIADVSISKTLNTPTAVQAGGPVDYDVTYANNGPWALNVSQFDGSGINPFATALFFDLLPPNLTYVSQSNPDLNCTWYGPGSAALAPWFSNHNDYSILLCTYAGEATSLQSGESIQTTISTTANTVPESFVNYAVANADASDPDLSILQASYNWADAIDYMVSHQNNNLASATYHAPQTGNGGLVGDIVVGALLPKTGQGQLVLATVIATLLAILAMYYVRKRQRAHE